MREMDNVKLPDLKKIREVKKRLKDLPPQESVTDTSNWENRDISAPVIGESGKGIMRKLDFLRSKEPGVVTREQIQERQRSDKKPRVR